MEGNQGNKTTEMCQNFYYKYFPSMIFSRKTTFNFSQSNAFFDTGWLKDAKNEYTTVRNHTVIDMGLISEAVDDKSFHGKIPQLLLSSVSSSTAVYLYTPEKSQVQSQFLASILSV